MSGRVPKTLAALGLALTLISSYGCANGQSAAPTPSSPYLLGYVGPLTGALASLGNGYLTGFKTAIDYSNKHGGVNGRQIKILSSDDTGTPDGAITAVRDLSQQGVLGIFGVPLSAGVAAARPTVARERLVLLTVAAGTSDLIPAQPYLFNANNTTVGGAEPMVKFTSDLLGGSGTIAIGPVATPGGAEWAAIITNKWAKASNLQVIHSTDLPVTAADFTAVAQKLMAGNPDAILVQPVGPAIATLSQKLRSLGYAKPIVAFLATGSEDIYTQLADQNLYAMGEVFGSGVAADGKPGLAQYRAAASGSGTTADAKASNIFAPGYLGGLTFAGTLGKCGSQCDRPHFQQALNTLELDTKGLTAAKAISFTSQEHQGVKLAFFYHWNGGGLSAALNGRAYPSSIYDTTH